MNGFFSVNMEGRGGQRCSMTKKVVLSGGTCTGWKKVQQPSGFPAVDKHSITDRQLSHHEVFLQFCTFSSAISCNSLIGNIVGQQDVSKKRQPSYYKVTHLCELISFFVATKHCAGLYRHTHLAATMEVDAILTVISKTV
ncbi:hypothetical protein RvY_14003 [Ramazzottius varieornatus]|uniref:Uncharacterized protein n=1 Tax=Ramazzottius varieornatus TaxID=947166 RepID=A0A1D1VPV6_RAMVA|nr:hypothetical protein RvY_14003 [Ramazzottius varieornatus]